MNRGGLEPNHHYAEKRHNAFHRESLWLRVTLVIGGHYSRPGG
jgi:hypothetical protein